METPSNSNRLRPRFAHGVSSTYERPLPFLGMTRNRIMVTNFHGLRIRITRGKQLFTEESTYNDSNNSMNFILEMIVNVLFKLARWMLSINFYYPEEKDDFLQWSTIGEDLESWITKARFEMKISLRLADTTRLILIGFGRHQSSISLKALLRFRMMIPFTTHTSS